MDPTTVSLNPHSTRSPLTPNSQTSLIPISIFRLLSLSHTLHSQNYPFHASTTQLLTQTEQACTLINATVLCLHNFLRLANSGITDMTVGTQGAVESLYGKLSAVKSKSGGGSNKSHHLKGGFENVKLATLSRSQNTATAAHGDSISVASDSSQRNIFVRRTVDVQYGAPEPGTQREHASSPVNKGAWVSGQEQRYSRRGVEKGSRQSCPIQVRYVAGEMR